MFRRLYCTIRKKYGKHGQVWLCKQKQWHWIKNNGIQRKYKIGGVKKTLWSRRFGYIDAYTAKEKKNLICPSGYSFQQGMYKLKKLWWGYWKSKVESDITKMEYFAREIQKIQDDLGLKTASFPHLGIYGELLVFADHKGGTKLEVDHSHLKEKQDMEEAKERVHEAIADFDFGFELAEGEKIVTMADEIPKEPLPKIRIKHANRMHYSKKRDYEWTCEKCDEIVPPYKNHICARKKEETTTITFTDDIPFREYQY